jgi:quercetin dioxygenase-like cupin family protein
MEIAGYKQGETMKNPHGIKAVKLYDSEFAEVIHISLAPGESLVRHITPVDAAFYVLEGQAVIEIGAEKEVVEQDNLVKSPKGIPHLISNQSEGLLRVLVMKLPKPSSPTIIVE